MLQNQRWGQNKFSVSLYVEGKDVHLGPFLLEIFPNMTLGILKEKVANEYGIEVAEQKWILGNTLACEDKATLSSYGVLPDSYIFLYLKSGHSLKFNETVIKSKNIVKATRQIFTAYNEMKDVAVGNTSTKFRFNKAFIKSALDRRASLYDPEQNGSESLKHAPGLKNFKSHSLSSEENFPVMFDHLTKTTCSDIENSKVNFSIPSSPHFHRRFSKERGLRNIILPLARKKSSFDPKGHGYSSSSPRRFSDDYSQMSNLEKMNGLHVGAEKIESMDDVGGRIKNFHLIDSAETSNKNINVGPNTKVELKLEGLSLENNASEIDNDKPKNSIQPSERKLCEGAMDVVHKLQKLADILQTSVPCNSSNSNWDKSNPKFVELPLSGSIEIAQTPSQEQGKQSITHPNELLQECCEDFKRNGDDAVNTSEDVCNPFEISTSVTGGTDKEKWPCEGKKNNSSAIGISKEAMINFQNLIELDAQDLIPNCEAFDCVICFLAVQPGSGVILRDCLHTFCRECLTKLVMYSEEALVKCPFRNEFYSCESHLLQREIKSLVSSDLFEQYLRRSVITAESRSEGSFHCRDPDCSGWCLYEKGVNIFHCPICHHYNCLTCKAIHEGLNCLQYQKTLKKSLIHDKDAEKTQELFNKMFKEGKAMKCPKCQAFLMKKWGCDWLKCSVCQTEICWITKGARWGPKGHGDVSGGCRCGVNGVKCHPSCTYCH